MATYRELNDLVRNEELRDKITAACVVASDVIRTEDGGSANHANRVIWAKKVLANPKLEAEKVIPLVIAANKDATAANIAGASDTAIQNNVNAVIDFIADGS